MADAELVRQASSDTDTERSDAEEWALVNNSAEIVEVKHKSTNLFFFLHIESCFKFLLFSSEFELSN